MIEFIVCMTRLPDMTREDFKKYWMNMHGSFFMYKADVMGAIKKSAIPHIGYTVE